MRHAALFNGIGGFQLAAQWVGWDNVMSCEIDPFCNQITKYHFPNCIQHGDIKTTDFARYAGRIDIVSGGFPCQPYSNAGKRLGKDDERHLWPEMLRAIREIQPGYVVGENVRGLTNWNGGLVFDEVQADLEAQGYEVLPFLLPACAVNAPHRRDRIWFIAFNAKFATDGRYNAGASSGTGMDMERNELVKARRNKSTNNTKSSGVNVAHPNDTRAIYFGKVKQQGTQINKRQKEQPQPKYRENGSNVDAPDTKNIRHQYGEDCDKRNTGELHQGEQRQHEKDGCQPERYSKVAANDIGDHWQNFPTQPPVCSGNDGVSGGLDGIAFSKWRQNSIKAYGNAIVPQVALQIFKIIQRMEAA